MMNGPRYSVLNAFPGSGVSPRVTISEALMTPIVTIWPTIQNSTATSAPTTNESIVKRRIAPTRFTITTINTMRISGPTYCWNFFQA